MIVLDTDILTLLSYGQTGFAFFGVRRFTAAFFLSVFKKKQAKQSGG